MGTIAAEEDPSNTLLDVHIRLEWRREIGFADVDCDWKWRELPFWWTGNRLPPRPDVVSSV